MLEVVGWDRDDRKSGSEVSNVYIFKPAKSLLRYPVGVAKGVAIMTDGRETTAFKIMTCELLWRRKGKGLCCDSKNSIVYAIGKDNKQVISINLLDGSIVKTVNLNNRIDGAVKCTDDGSFLLQGVGQGEFSVFRPNTGEVNGILSVNTKVGGQISRVDFVHGSDELVGYIFPERVAIYKRK